MRGLKYFDAWFGAHQKIDRIARLHLERLQPGVRFPTRKEILRFEGMDGPDGIKRKTPAQDEPKHFFNPLDVHDTELLTIIRDHYDQLVAAMRGSNETRASFEAAWLAHAVVDGLTPAHQYPYEAEIVRLRQGATDADISGPVDKLLMRGDTLSQRISNNWQMWGDRGLLAMHIAFEIGIAVVIAPLPLRRAMPSADELTGAARRTVEQLFTERAQLVDGLHLYERFYKSGWTPRLAKLVRRELMPIIINTVTLVWYKAAQEAAV